LLDPRTPSDLPAFAIAPAVTESVISECLADGFSPQSCFGDSAADGDWSILWYALGS
jgi:hypothetical protein